MRIFKFFLMGLLVVLSTVAFAAPEVKPEAKKPETTKLDVGTRLKKNVFSGQESRISAYNIVLSDCSSGPLPAVRIVKAPAKGEVRFNPTRIAINRSPERSTAHCNGMQAEALGVYYKAPGDFTGEEQITIDADWRNGKITRYLYTITVR